MYTVMYHITMMTDTYSHASLDNQDKEGLTSLQHVSCFAFVVSPLPPCSLTPGNHRSVL